LVINIHSIHDARSEKHQIGRTCRKWESNINLVVKEKEVWAWNRLIFL